MNDKKLSLWVGSILESLCTVQCVAGCSVGSSLLLWSFPLAESVFGTVGLQSAILFNLANIFAGRVFNCCEDTMT